MCTPDAVRAFSVYDVPANLEHTHELFTALALIGQASAAPKALAIANSSVWQYFSNFTRKYMSDPNSVRNAVFAGTPSARHPQPVCPWLTTPPPPRHHRLTPLSSPHPNHFSHS